MRGAPGNCVGAEQALARRKRAQTVAIRGHPRPPGPPGDTRAESPPDPLQSAGGKEQGLQTARRPGKRRAPGQGKPWTGLRRAHRAP
uniref:Germ line n-myc protein n=1 Tax=Homo sapiens TaxID=9606 RepID=V9H1L1_HUMAN|nr:hypothetical protein (N-myc 5' region) - human [Homo sapiens]CAA68677.1 unnamed protein product [Homo sapiens]